MLSIALKKNSQTVPVEDKQLPRKSNIITLNNKQMDSPVKNISYGFDDMHFGTSPPGKNFMENLKSRMEKM